MEQDRTRLERIILAYTGFAGRHPVVMIAAAVLLVGTLAAFIPRLTFDNTPDSFFLPGDPTLAIYNEFRDRFEGDEYSLIVLDAPQRWTPQALAPVRKLGRTLASLDHVREVTSIANVRHIAGDTAAITVGDFLPADLEPRAYAQRRETALNHPYYRNVYVSADGRYFGVIVETEIIRGEVDYKIALTEKMRRLLAEPPYAPMNPKLVGAPVLDADVRRIVGQESATFGAAVFVLICIGFLLVFRSAAGVVLPMLIAAGAIAGSFGVMAIIGAPVGLLTPIIPSFLISVGVGGAVFLLTELYNQARRGSDPAQATRETMCVAGIPAVLAACTTASALFAFASSRIAPVRDVGIVMGVGLLIAMALTMILVPTVFQRLKSIRPSPRRDRMIAGRIRWLDRVAGFVLARPRAILVVAAGVLAVALAGVYQVKSDYYYLGNFKTDTPLRQDYQAADNAIPVSSSIEIMVRADERDAFKSPETLAFIEALQRHIEDHSTLVTNTYSLVNVVKEIYQALNDGDETAYRIPDSRPAVAQSLLLFESSGHDELSELVSADYDAARLTVMLPTRPDSEYRPLIDTIHTFIDQQQQANPAYRDLEVDVTGLVPMWIRINDYLTASQVKSVLIAIGVITLVMMVVFRSVVLGLLMSGVNLSVVALALGIMGWAGIALDPYTILVSAIALGILDDDTLHFIKHIYYRYERGHPLTDAIREAYRSAGLSMLYTTTVLVLSFSVYALSTVASLSKFGLLIALTLLIGIVVEYLVTPAVLLVLESRRRRPARTGPAHSPATDP